jgi:integrase
MAIAMSKSAMKVAAGGYIKDSVASGTLKGYKKEWIKWLDFARRFGYRLAPPRPSDMEEYLVSVVSCRVSVAVLALVSALVAWHCAEVGNRSPFENKRIALLVRGMKARFRCLAQLRLPFKRSHIRKFMDLVGSVEDRWLWRVAVVISVCFSDFLRFAEVVAVRLKDISVRKGFISFRVRKAKNHCLGFDITLPVDKKRRYFVGAFLLRFLERGLKWSPGDVGLLCCRMDASGFRPAAAVGYSTLHAACKELINALGLDPSRF